MKGGMSENKKRNKLYLPTHFDEDFLLLRNIVPLEFHRMLHQLESKMSDCRIERTTGQIETGLGTQRGDFLEPIW